MFLIASAAFLDAEFQVEFGKLPPAFLPIGNRRLFEHQLEVIKKNFPSESVCLSLPESYDLSKKDRIFLEKENINVIYSNPALTLGSAIEQAIILMGASSDDGVLRLLHGDTLILDIPNEIDVIAVANTSYDYRWEVESAGTQSESVWCGFFSFAQPKILCDILNVNNGSFSNAIYDYSKICSLSRIGVCDWLDFGHINLYFRNRSRLTSERAFNKLIIENGCVRKSGLPFNKIEAEWRWFKSLPVDMRIYAPSLIDHGLSEDESPFYKLEYLALVPLNEVYVHGRNSTFYWSNIFDHCAGFFKQCQLHSIQNGVLEAEHFSKKFEKLVWDRVDEYSLSSSHAELDVLNVFNGRELPSLRFIINDCLNRTSKIGSLTTLLHGDFCLSNIFFDSRLDRIKIIDPRGIDLGGNITNQGDLRYDLAKLAHSIIGLYDYIVAGAYDLSYTLDTSMNTYTLDIYTDKRIYDVQSAFVDHDFLVGVTVREIMPLTALLFLTMLPLHTEDATRQVALLANALRIYAEEIF